MQPRNAIEKSDYRERPLFPVFQPQTSALVEDLVQVFSNEIDRLVGLDSTRGDQLTHLADQVGHLTKEVATLKESIQTLIDKQPDEEYNDID